MDFFKDKSPSLYLRKVEVRHSKFFKNEHPVNGGKNLNSDMLKSVQITYFGPFTFFENLSKEELLKIIQENKKIIQDQKHLIAEQISTIDK